MKRLLIASLFLFASSAQAGFLLEPYAGLSFGSGENSATIKTEYDYNAPMLGARAGYQYLGLMFGLDYSMGMDQKTAGSTVTADVSQSTLGLFVGYNLPVMLRAWAAYYLNTSLEVEAGTSVGDEFNGKGYGLGVGFTGLPFVSLNLEYRMMTFDEYKDKSAGSTATLSGASEIDFNQILLSVSLPLDL